MMGHSLLPGLFALMMVAGSEGLLRLPSAHSEFDWHHNGLMYKDLDHVFDSMFADMYDLGLVPRSRVSSYYGSACRRASAPQRVSPCGNGDVDICNSQIAERGYEQLSTAEQERQARISQLQQERMKQASLRREHERLEREAEEQIQLLRQRSERETVQQTRQQPKRETVQPTQQQSDRDTVQPTQQQPSIRQRPTGQEMREQLLREELQREQLHREELHREQSLRKQLQREQLHKEQLRKEQLAKEKQMGEWKRHEKARLRQEEMLRAKKAEEEARLRKLESVRQQREGEKLKRRREELVQQRQSLRHTEKLAEHMASGYYADEISVTVADERIRVSGNHICSCVEDCITKEFSRNYALPAHVDPTTVEASLDAQGKLTLTGRRGKSRQSSNSESVEVKVHGKTGGERLSRQEQRACLNSKGGIKLNKVDKRTGQVVDSLPVETQLNSDYDFRTDRTYMEDDEFSTIEVQVEH